MEVVAICCPLSSPIGPQRVIIMVISVIAMNFLILRVRSLKFQKSMPARRKILPSFSIHHGKHHHSCCYTPCMPFPFSITLPIWSTTSRKTIRKNNYWKKARFDREITVRDTGNGMVGKQRDVVKDSYFEIRYEKIFIVVDFEFSASRQESISDFRINEWSSRQYDISFQHTVPMDLMCKEGEWHIVDIFYSLSTLWTHLWLFWNSLIWWRTSPRKQKPFYPTKSNLPFQCSVLVFAR